MTYEDARIICAKVEAVCTKFGCHVALTGGALYRTGSRKDLDLLFYRVRQIAAIDQAGLFAALREIGFGAIRGFGWVFKSDIEGFPVDLFFPEEKAVISDPVTLSKAAVKSSSGN